jgi:conjugative transfer signal peptidase TraF
MIPLSYRQIGAIAAMVIAVGLIVVALTHRPAPKILYNPSPSAPRGWYMVKSPAELSRGDFALVKLPASIARFADQRRYLPMTVPLLKRVGAVAGDRVCETQGLVYINGVLAAQSLERDGAGRSLVTWSDCRRLKVVELFLLGTSSAASFDSRYYGPVTVKSVIGVAVPVWTW